jgi:GT2 family glycosyltransferase
MATDPLTTTSNGGATPSIYSDPGLGSDAALDAFAGELVDSVPIDPTELLTHDVTAVLVAHNGSRWLPRTLQALAALRRMPERIIAVDTGSKDDTGELLTRALGAPAVVSAPRTSGFGAAVAAGVQAADQMAQAGFGFGAAGARRTAWVWVLHDDSAPAPDALARLLEGAVRRPDAGILGPKVLDWRDHRQLLEVGLTVTSGGRRHTGLDRREYDQGQHDDPRDVLAVGSAGMLIRRDVWDQLGGFDQELALFRDDLDLGWRANEAGHKVIFCPEATIYHAEAAAHGRRRLGATRDRPHLADRRNALYVLLANASARSLLFVLIRVFVMGLGRSVTFLIGKQPALAAEELVALVSVVGRPDVLIRARARRRETRKRSPAQLRSLFPPRGQQLRHASENVLSVLTGSGGGAGHDVSGARRAVSNDEDGDIPDSDDTFVLRFLLHPAVVLVVALTVVSLIAVRGLIGTGRLFGGALLPAPADPAGFWQAYTESWHGSGLGSASASPPYLVALAVVATIIQHAPLAIDLLLLGCVPLAGTTMYLLVRRIVATKVLRVWVAGTYALLPATTGAVAAGRLGTVCATVLTPLLVLAVLRTLGTPRRPGPGRAAWSAGLLLAIVSAFVPLAWVIAAVLGLVAVTTVYRGRRALLRVGVILAVTPIVLIPWTGSVLRHPMLFVTEAGLPGPHLSDAQLPPWAVLLHNPGGPGSGPMWLGIGVALAAWAALFRSDRRARVGAAWVVAGVALVAGIALSRVAVDGPTLETPVAGWPGYPAVLVGGALLIAAAIGAEGAREWLSKASFGWRQPVAVAVLAAAVAGPVVGAGWWILRGASEPLERRDEQILPAYVADEADRPERIRTLVLNRSNDGRITYALLRESGPHLGEAETSPPPEKYGPLDDVVADIVSGRGAADATRLAEFAAKYVYLPRPFDPDLADTLDTVPGLVRVSAPEGAAMWKVDQPVGRVWITEPSADATTPNQATGQPVPIIPSGTTEAKGSVPEGDQDRLLVISELADSGWTAKLDGRELTPTTYAGWAQAFRLGSQAGDVTVAYTGNRRSVWLQLQLVAVIAAVILALPGIRRERGAVDDAAEVDPDESSPNLALVSALPSVTTPPVTRPNRAHVAEPAQPPMTEQPAGSWDPFERANDGLTGSKDQVGPGPQVTGRSGPPSGSTSDATSQPSSGLRQAGNTPVPESIPSYRGRRAGRAANEGDSSEATAGPSPEASSNYRGRRAAGDKRVAGRRAKGRRGGGT